MYLNLLECLRLILFLSNSAFEIIKGHSLINLQFKNKLNKMMKKVYTVPTPRD